MSADKNVFVTSSNFGIGSTNARAATRRRDRGARPRRAVRRDALLAMIELLKRNL